MELDDLNLPVQVADAVNAALARVGVDLPLFFTQFAALVLSLLALAYGVRKLRKEGLGSLLGLLVVAGFGLFALGVLAAWGQGAFFPLPGEVTGQVALEWGGAGPPAVRLDQVRVALLDSRGEDVARESGAVDGRTGYFFLTYAPAIGERPRAVRVSAPGCPPLDVALSRSRLRAGAALHLAYPCGGGP
jgi:hypothetical protein